MTTHSWPRWPLAVMFAALALAAVPAPGPFAGVALAVLALVGLLWQWSRTSARTADEHREAMRVAANQAHERLREERRREKLVLDEIDVRTDAMSDRLGGIRDQLEVTEETLAERTSELHDLAEKIRRMELDAAAPEAPEAEVLALPKRRMRALEA